MISSLFPPNSLRYEPLRSMFLHVLWLRGTAALAQLGGVQLRQNTGPWVSWYCWDPHGKAVETILKTPPQKGAPGGLARGSSMPDPSGLRRELGTFGSQGALRLPRGPLEAAVHHPLERRYNQRTYTHIDPKSPTSNVCNSPFPL